MGNDVGYEYKVRECEADIRACGCVQGIGSGSLDGCMRL